MLKVPPPGPLTLTMRLALAPLGSQFCFVLAVVSRPGWPETPVISPWVASLALRPVSVLTQLVPLFSRPRVPGDVIAPFWLSKHLPAGLSVCHCWCLARLSGGCSPVAMFSGRSVAAVVPLRGSLRVPKLPSLDPCAHWSTAVPTRMPNACEAADQVPGECGLVIGFSVPVESYTRTYQAACV